MLNALTVIVTVFETEQEHDATIYRVRKAKPSSRNGLQHELTCRVSNR